MFARTFTTAALAVSLGYLSSSDAGPLYLKESTINSIQPGAPQIPYPGEKTEIYNNEVGFPAWHLATYPYDPAKPQLPGARYPNPDPDHIYGDRADYWNLLNTANSPGWVYADPDEEVRASRRYLQFAMLSKNVADHRAVGKIGNDFKLYYRVSTTGGLTFPNGQKFFAVIAAGYDLLHPFPNQSIGTDGANMPGIGAIKKSLAGDVLAGMTITHGPQDHVSSVTVAYALRGKWNTDNTVAWEISQPGHVPTQWSTRGGDEPAVQELSAVNTGAVNCVMVARGSNEFFGPAADDQDECKLHDKYRPGLAGHHWLFRSKDGCATWDGPPIRLSYNDGTPFYAPAANSTLFRSPRDNRVYWVGAISASNSKGNWPRTKLVSGELDLQSSTPGIIKDSMIVLDERYGSGDSDRLNLNDAQLAMQTDGSAFLYLKRQDAACTGCNENSLSWYSLDVAEPGGVTLAVTPSSGSTHHLNWQANVPNVAKYHIRRRYLSGAPLTDLWKEVGMEQGSSTGITIAGYETWQEAEYEIVAELTTGAAITSNRVVARFTQWQGPRLSFTFATETQPGDPVPMGSVGIAWTYAQPQFLTGFRLYRRYLDGNWAAIGDLNSSLRGVTLGGYSETDRFELRIDATTANGAQLASNVVSVRFPKECDADRRPY